MKNIAILLLLIASFALNGAQAKEVNNIILPLPQKVEWYSGTFNAKRIAVVCDSTDTRNNVLTLLSEFPQIKVDNASKKALKICFVNRVSGTDNITESYTLRITSDNIELQAVTQEGAYRGLQTLRSLFNDPSKGNNIRCCSITDYPAFNIRGIMQDVGRSFISIDELKREIDAMARYKMNTFHIHLTENQAWRLESKIYPQLTQAENMTRMKGNYYSQDDMRELSRYCRERYITLIPEIDMPGHSEAFVRTFHCDMQSPEGMKIIKELVAEACSVFANEPYIHIGTDETAFTNPDFVPEMVKFIRERGKKVISWNPGWNYKQGEIDMTQLWSYRGKPTTGVPFIDCRFHYANHFDSYGDLFAIYNSNIYHATQGDKYNQGVIIALWNDRMLQTEQDIPLQNSLYPYMLAIAERSWHGGGHEYFDRDGVRIPESNTPQYKEFADFERRMLWHKEHFFNGYPFPYVKQTNVKWRITDAFPNEGNLSQSFPPENSIDTAYTYNGKVYPTHYATGAGIYLRHVWGTLIPAFYKEPQENCTAYAYTYVYSPRKQEAGLVFETQNYSRSEKDLPPQQGKWDYRESKIWLNENEILPPVWTATHTEKNNEIPLGNENACARKPIPVTLNKGWNKILIKLPVGKFNTPQVRLVKWMFTAVITTPDGKTELNNITYSPDKKK